MFRVHSSLDLRKPATTRFAYHFIVLERLLQVRPALRQMAASPEFAQWPRSTEPAGLRFQRIVFGEDFWRQAEELVDVMRPVYHVLRLVDREGCTLGLIYEFMDRIGEALRRPILDEPRMTAIRERWLQRWNFFHKPIHAVAHLLHPMWATGSIRVDVELVQGWRTYTRDVYPGQVPALHIIERQLLDFERRQGAFRGCEAYDDFLPEPLTWWGVVGKLAPELTTFATRILAQDCSASACERNWSTWSLHHSRRRNQLRIPQLDRLVYCTTNMRLVRHMQTDGTPRQVDPTECLSSIDTTPVRADTAAAADDEIFSQYHRELAEHGRRHRRTTRAMASADAAQEGDDELDDLFAEAEGEGLFGDMEVDTADIDEVPSTFVDPDAETQPEPASPVRRRRGRPRTRLMDLHVEPEYYQGQAPVSQAEGTGRGRGRSRGRGRGRGRASRTLQHIPEEDSLSSTSSTSDSYEEEDSSEHDAHD